jgi:hypothetical protein
LVLADGVAPTWLLSPVRGAFLTSFAAPGGEFCGALLMVWAKVPPVMSAAIAVASRSFLVMSTPIHSIALADRQRRANEAAPDFIR